MKYFSITILLTSLSMFAFGQSSYQKTDSSVSKIDKRGYQLKITASVNNAERVRLHRKELIDSLNNYSGGVLPYFLSDACIEHRRKYFEGFHITECLRCAILDSVKSKVALQLILKSNSLDLDKICTDTSYYMEDKDSTDYELLDGMLQRQPDGTWHERQEHQRGTEVMYEYKQTNVIPGTIEYRRLDGTVDLFVDFPQRKICWRETAPRNGAGEYHCPYAVVSFD